MVDAESICRDVKRQVPNIMEHWEALTERRPWLVLPENIKLDHIPDLVAALAEAVVCAEGEDAPKREALEAGLKHGRHRRESGLEDHVLFQEFHLLREALWTSIRERHSGSPAYDAITRLDSALTMVTRASLAGYHGADEDHGVIDRLLEQGPWPPPFQQD